MFDFGTAVDRIAQHFIDKLAPKLSFGASIKVVEEHQAVVVVSIYSMGVCR